MDSNDTYTNKALQYAERYGIITYKVKGKYMIYNQNYSNSEFMGGKWVSKPCTYQTVVDLETGNESRNKLQRLQKNGWDNV